MGTYYAKSNGEAFRILMRGDTVSYTSDLDPDVLERMVSRFHRTLEPMTAGFRAVTKRGYPKGGAARDPGGYVWYVDTYDSRGAFPTTTYAGKDKAKALKMARKYRTEGWKKVTVRREYVSPSEYRRVRSHLRHPERFEKFVERGGSRGPSEATYRRAQKRFKKREEKWRSR